MKRDLFNSHLWVNLGLFAGLVLVLTGAWYSGGVFSARMTWLIALPLIAFYFVSDRAGFAWFVVVLLSEIAVGLVTWHMGLSTYIHYEPAEMTLSFASHAMVTLVAIALGFFSVQLFLKTYYARAQRYKALEEQRQSLLQTAAQRAQFVSTISEKLRTPMQNILSLNNQLMVRVQDNPRGIKVLTHTRQSADHLLTVISDLVDSDDMAAGKINVHCETFVLRETIQTAFELFRPQVEAMGLSYRLDVAPEVPEKVWAGRHRLMQILVNLLGNAVKFTSQGEVSLRVSTVEGGVKFAIQDTGIGIPEEEQALIFKRFAQANENIQTQFGGHGLGLFITQRLVDVMEGQMGLESQAGKGATFWFVLPLTPIKPAVS